MKGKEPVTELLFAVILAICFFTLGHLVGHSQGYNKGFEVATNHLESKLD